MNLEIILVGIIVGIANFASRFGPFFRNTKTTGQPTKTRLNLDQNCLRKYWNICN